jgi:hypothetical protein
MAALTTAELEAIRAQLAAGKRPRVVFTTAAGQIAGQAGNVVALTDPAASEEWVVVRFGRDELPFSPADLALPGRNGNGRAEPKAVTVRISPARVSPAKAAAARPVPPTRPVPAPRKEAKAEPAPPSTVESVAAKPAKPPKPPAALAVTVAYAEGQWTVAASQGAKTLAKPAAIRASEALRMVAMIEAPSVHDAVEHIIAAERTAAENQAQRLRRELADIESRLAELRDTH